MEHGWHWAYIATITSLGLAVYIIMNHPMNYWGLIAVIVMALTSLFMAQMYIALVKTIDEKLLEEAVNAGLTEIGEGTLED